MARSHRTAPLRALVLIGLVSGVSAVSAGTALAATTSTSANGVVTITTDGAVTVTCDSEGGALLVNGADVGSGFVYCEDTTSIRVIGDAAVNTIDLSDIGPFDLANGASTDVQGNDGADVITGSEVPDQISGGVGADVITSGGGNDLIKGGLGADGISGGAGTDMLVERGDVDLILTDTSLTGLGADVLSSIERAKLAGGSSWNTIDASAFTGSAVLSGGRGNDVLTGGLGNDLLRGSSGTDSLTGGDGLDALYAGEGDDSLDSTDGVAGNDLVQGDRGLDTCTTDVGDESTPGDQVWGCELQI
jgi:Ca2+-binding RTX toxin-like protein